MKIPARGDWKHYILDGKKYPAKQVIAYTQNDSENYAKLPNHRFGVLTGDGPILLYRYASAHSPTYYSPGVSSGAFASGGRTSSAGVVLYYIEKKGSGDFKRLNIKNLRASIGNPSPNIEMYLNTAKQKQQTANIFKWAIPSCLIGGIGTLVLLKSKGEKIAGGLVFIGMPTAFYGPLYCFNQDASSITSSIRDLRP